MEQPIGCGLSGRVYLAEHRKLKAKRVIKCVNKHHFMYQQFLTEATLLKNLKHPGIPIIYDLEEDEEYLYIIEEYIKGESLKAVMLNQKTISREAVIDFTIQICNIIEYLHNIKPYPILYLDLKPDHIIVCKDCIKIIDFGSAIYMEKEEVDYSFGTPCFAAPEQYNSLKLDSKADIYAIGCILYYMLIGKNPSPKISYKSLLNDLNDLPNHLKKIILKCMAENPQNRFDSVSQLKNKLSVFNQKNSLIIAVLGSQKRIGVSHIAIGLVSYLNKYGIKALYEDKTNRDICSDLYDTNDSIKEENGIYYVKNFEGIPNYNNTICISKSNYDIIVLDCGSDLDLCPEFRAADIKLLVLGTKAWELEQAKERVEVLKDVKVQYIFNLCEKQQAYKAARFLAIKRGYRMPLFFDPFTGYQIAEKVFKAMLKETVFHVKRRRKIKR